MSRAPAPGRLAHSIWDRLVGGDGPAATPAADLAAVRAEVCRDLERLLNSRRFHREDELDAPHLDRSLLAYGIPELSAFNPDSATDRTRLTRLIQLAIARFEPRLAPLDDARPFVDVEYRQSDQDRHLPRIHLRIRARLRLEGLDDSVEFDTELDLGSRAFEIRR
jgi:type VI secretion system protein ImpF